MSAAGAAGGASRAGGMAGSAGRPDAADRAGGASSASGAGRVRGADTASGADSGGGSRTASGRFLNGLNPLAKIAGPLPAMVAVIVLRDVARPAVFVLLGLTLVLLGARLTLRRAALVLLGLPALFLVLSVSLGAWTAPGSDPGASLGMWAVPGRDPGDDVLVSIGTWDFTAGMWWVGAASAARLTALLALGLVAGMTMSGAELTRSLVQHLGLPYRLGYTALAAVRFVPRLRYERDTIRTAHRVRGSTGGGPLGEVRRLALPLLVGSVRHASRVALAMDARGFGAYAQRTERHVIAYRWRDTAFILGFWVVSAVVLVGLPHLVPAT